MTAYWTEAAKKRRDKFRTLLEDSKNDPILDLEFMDALSANYRRLNDRQRKRQIVIVTATLLLFVALVFPDVHLSFTGVGLEAKKFREILLVILSVATAMRFFGWSDTVQARELLQAYISKLSRNDPSLREASSLRFGLGGGSFFPQDMSSLSVWSHLFLMLFVICFRWILLRGTLFAMALIQMAGVISIVLDPSVSRALSVVVAVYLLAVVVVTAGLTLLEGPSEAKETSAPTS